MIRQISGKEYLLSLPMVEEYDPTRLNTFQLGQGFPKFNEKVKGLVLCTENEIQGVAPSLNAGGVTITAAQYQGFFFSFASPQNNNFMVALPGRALIISPTDTKKGQYYEVGQRINWAKSSIQITSALPALPAGQFYVLNLLIITE